eukprot:1418112-Rhodomonas_salina.1
MGTAVSMLKSIKLPGPIGPVFRKALSAAPLVTAKPIIDALQAGKMEDAVTALMSNPGLIMYLDKLKPGMMLAPLKTLFAEDFIRDAVAKVRQRVPDPAVAYKLQQITQNPFQSTEDLRKFCEQAREMIASQVEQARDRMASQVDNTVAQVIGHCFGSADTLAMSKVDFPNVLLQQLDMGTAVNMLKSIKAPGPVGPVFKKAVDVAVNAQLLPKLKPIMEALQKGRLEDAVKGL